MKNLLKSLYFKSTLLNGDRCLLKGLLCSRIETRTSSQQTVKEFSEIPGPPSLPLIKNLYILPSLMRNIHRQNELVNEQFDKYGPIFKQDLVTMAMVQVCRAEDVEMVMRHEGKYPRRVNLAPWLHWKEQNHATKGPLLAEGEQWKRLRSQLDKRMLRRDFVDGYLQDFKKISEDVVAKIQRSLRASQAHFPNIEDTFFHWSLQSSGMVVYDTYLGDSNTSQEITDLVKAVKNLFLATNKIFFTPDWFNRLFQAKWSRMHDQSWQTISNTTAALVGAKLKSLAESKGGDDDDSSGFLRHMFTSDLSESEIFGSINEIILGAVETTSTTMLWLMHELTKQPSLQQLLHKQVSLLPNGTPQCLNDLDQVPLVKAVVKETLRLYPVIGVLPRILPEDVVLSGYHVPKGTTVFLNLHTMGRSGDYFEHPEEFQAERWLRREGGEGARQKFASIPFGFGPRSCIGRRIAELEMHLLLCMLVYNFEITSVDPSPVYISNKSFTSPSRPLKFLFTPRN